MNRPPLQEVSLNRVMAGILRGQPSVNVTMSKGQWDAFLQASYNAGHNLIELDEHEVPVKAYRKEI